MIILARYLTASIVFYDFSRGRKMETRCEFAEKCPIVKYFGEQGWKVMLARYCYGNYPRCSRYRIHQAGQPVPEYVMPWDTDAESGR